MDRLFIRLDEEYGAKISALMKDTDRSAQKVGMQILREYFKVGGLKTELSNPEIKKEVISEQVEIPAQNKDDKIIEWVLGRYHTELPHGVQVNLGTLVGKNISKRIKALSKTSDFKTSGQWEDYFNLIKQSDWLMGRSGDWKASLTWLLGPKNMIKVLGGEYTSHTATVGAKTKSEVIDAKNIEAGMTFIERKRAQLQEQGR